MDVAEDVSYDTVLDSSDSAFDNIPEDVNTESFADTSFEATDEWIDSNEIDAYIEPDTDIPEDQSADAYLDDLDYRTNDNYDNFSEDEAPVKVLKLGGGDTDISNHDYKQELHELDEGISNAKEIYSGVKDDISLEVDRIANDENLSSEEKKAMLEQKKQEALNLEQQWNEDSDEWFKERDLLQEHIKYEDVDAEISILEDISTAQDDIEFDDKNINDIPEDILNEPFEESTNNVSENISETSNTPSSKMQDSNLFEDNKEKDYIYDETDYGKHASGQLQLDKGERSAYAQRTVGGEDRQRYDDGGHLIGSRFGGSGGYENLDAQSRDLNRGEYKNMENEWACSLKNGEKIYVDVKTYKSNDSERPDAFMGYSITENGTGVRSLDTFSFQNESSKISTLLQTLKL